MRIVVHGSRRSARACWTPAGAPGKRRRRLLCPEPAQGRAGRSLKEPRSPWSPVYQPRSFRNKPEVWEEFARLKAISA